MKIWDSVYTYQKPCSCNTFASVDVQLIVYNILFGRYKSVVHRGLDTYNRLTNLKLDFILGAMRFSAQMSMQNPKFIILAGEKLGLEAVFCTQISNIYSCVKLWHTWTMAGYRFLMSPWICMLWLGKSLNRVKGIAPLAQLSINCRIDCCFTEKYLSFKINLAHG